MNLFGRPDFDGVERRRQLLISSADFRVLSVCTYCRPEVQGNLEDFGSISQGYINWPESHSFRNYNNSPLPAFGLSARMSHKRDLQNEVTFSLTNASKICINPILLPPPRGDAKCIVPSPCFRKQQRN